jgi:hypothetical protein
MPRRFRPFGVLGSTLEVFVGLLALRSSLSEPEGDPGWVSTAEVAVGVILICAGAIGLVVAARRALAARSHRRDANAPQGP